MRTITYFNAYDENLGIVLRLIQKWFH